MRHCSRPWRLPGRDDRRSSPRSTPDPRALASPRFVRSGSTDHAAAGGGVPRNWRGGRDRGLGRHAERWAGKPARPAPSGCRDPFVTLVATGRRPLRADLARAEVGRDRPAPAASADWSATADRAPVPRWRRTSTWTAGSPRLHRLHAPAARTRPRGSRALLGGARADRLGRDPGSLRGRRQSVRARRPSQ